MSKGLEPGANIVRGSRGKKRRTGWQPIVHRLKYVQRLWPTGPHAAPWDFSNLRGAFQSPKDLTILTINTREEKGPFEQSLDFLGVRDYVVIKRSFEGAWRHTLKIEWILEYLESGKCQTHYLLYCDGFDTIMIDDPQKVLDIFLRLGGEAVFGSTMSRRGIFTEMPDLPLWVTCVVPDDSVPWSLVPDRQVDAPFGLQRSGYFSLLAPGVLPSDGCGLL